MEKPFNQIKTLKLLIRWKFHLLLIFIIAIILSIIFSAPFFITPMYKSIAIVYPANTSRYSDESESEQMLQIFESSDIRDSVIEQFNLFEHYKIDRNSKYSYHDMFEEYSDNVNVSRTQYDGLKIKVWDKDPQMACDMINAIIKFYNGKVKKLHHDKYQEVLAIYKEMKDYKLKEIDSVERKLTGIMTESNILDFDIQTKEVVRGFLGTVDGDNARLINKKEIKSLKEHLEKEGSRYIIDVQNLSYLLGNYNFYKKEYDEALKEVNKNYTYANVISNPFPADKQSFPIRWLVVLIFTLSATFLAFVVILILENYQSMMKDLI